MTEKEIIEFNVRQALADGEITREQAAYVRAQVELECSLVEFEQREETE
jgi:hypothetical protein